MQNRDNEKMGLQFFKGLTPQIKLKIAEYLSAIDKAHLSAVCTELHGPINKLNEFKKIKYKAKWAKEAFKKVIAPSRVLVTHMGESDGAFALILLTIIGPPDLMAATLSMPIGFFAGCAKEVTENRRKNETDQINKNIRPFRGEYCGL